MENINSNNNVSDVRSALNIVQDLATIRFNFTELLKQKKSNIYVNNDLDLTLEFIMDVLDLSNGHIKENIVSENIQNLAKCKELLKKKKQKYLELYSLSSDKKITLKINQVLKSEYSKIITKYGSSLDILKELKSKNQKLEFNNMIEDMLLLFDESFTIEMEKEVQELTNSFIILKKIVENSNLKIVQAAKTGNEVKLNFELNTDDFKEVPGLDEPFCKQNDKLLPWSNIGKNGKPNQSPPPITAESFKKGYDLETPIDITETTGSTDGVEYIDDELDNLIIDEVTYNNNEAEDDLEIDIDIEDEAIDNLNEMEDTSKIDIDIEDEAADNLNKIEDTSEIDIDIQTDLVEVTKQILYLNNSTLKECIKYDNPFKKLDSIILNNEFDNDDENNKKLIKKLIKKSLKLFQKREDPLNELKKWINSDYCDVNNAYEQKQIIKFILQIHPNKIFLEEFGEFTKIVAKKLNQKSYILDLLEIRLNRIKGEYDGEQDIVKCLNDTIDALGDDIKGDLYRTVIKRKNKRKSIWKLTKKVIDKEFQSVVEAYNGK